MKYVLGFLVLTLAGCGTMGGKFDKAAVGQVKSVAIVGYTMDYKMDMGDTLKSAVLGGEKTDGMAGKTDTRSEETAISKASYEQMAKALEQLHWKVKDAEQTAASQSLKAFNARSVKTGFLPLQQRHARQERAGIPMYHHIAALAAKDPAQMKAIAKELGVDALAFVYVTTEFGTGFSVGPIGVGTYKYSSNIILDIYDPRSDQLIGKVTVNGEGVKEDKTPKAFGGDVIMANTFSGVKGAANQLVASIKEKL
jgi:hypothetical protein